MERQEDREMAATVQAIEAAQRRSTALRRRNRVLAVMLATAALAVLAVAVTVAVTIHNAEAGHALAPL